MRATINLCHPERSEGSNTSEILHYVQDDNQQYRLQTNCHTYLRLANFR
jgi:hypothetical protein